MHSRVGVWRPAFGGVSRFQRFLSCPIVLSRWHSLIIVLQSCRGAYQSTSCHTTVHHSIPCDTCISIIHLIIPYHTIPYQVSSYSNIPCHTTSNHTASHHTIPHRPQCIISYSHRFDESIPITLHSIHKMSFHVEPYHNRTYHMI